MTCPECGRYAPPDTETGYDADAYCPDCRHLEESTVTVRCALCAGPVHVATRIFRPYRTYYCETCHRAVLKRATA